MSNIDSLRSIRVQYLTGLALILLLSIGTHLLRESVLRVIAEDAATINTAGRQRMLSQRIASHGLELAIDKGRNDAVRSSMRQAIALMERAHQSLVDASRSTGDSESRLRGIYFSPGDLDARLKLFLGRAHRVLDVPPGSLEPTHPDLVALVDQARTGLIQGLEMVVKTYESESRGRIDQLQQLEIMALLLLVLTIFLEAAFIFFPLERSLKRAFTQLAVREASFRAAFDLAATGTALVGTDGRYLRVNRVLCKLLGYSESALLGRSAESLTHADDRGADQNLDRRLLTGEIEAYGQEKRYLHQDGHEVWVLVNVALVDSQNGQPPYLVHHVQDLSQRRKAEAAALEGQFRFRAALDASLDAFFVLQSVRNASGQIEDFTFTELNRVAEGLLGRSRETLIGARLCGLYPANRTSGLFDRYAQVVENRVPFENEFETTTPGLSATWLHVQATPLDDGLVLTTRDITERKLAEKALLESEARFRALFEHNPDGVVLIDPHDPNVPWAIVDCNDTFCQMNGYTRQELIGQSIDVLHDHALMAEQGEPLLEWIRAQGMAHGEGLHRHRDGFTFEIESASSIVTVGGRELVLGLDRDITQRKRAEATLLESEARFRTAIDYSPIGQALVATDGHFIRVNNALAQILGYTTDELLQIDFQSITHPDDLELDLGLLNQTLNRERDSYQIEKRYRHRDGHEVMAQLDVALIREPHGQPLYFVSQIQDITDRRRVQKELQKFADQLERSNRDLQEFAQVASHDLQEPLRKIQMFGDRLKANSAASLDPTGMDYLERMRGAAGRMQVLIQDLLTLSRVAGQARTLVAVDLDRVVGEVLEDLEARIERSGGRVEVGRLATIQADPLQMRQVLQNLIGNALKFHRPEEAPVVKVSGSLRSQLRGQVFELRVEDNGIGFDEKHLERIFTPFQRLHTRSEFEGTGMGLAICRRIAERHGGTMSAQSVPGVGSVFSMCIPIRLQSFKPETSREVLNP